MERQGLARPGGVHQGQPGTAGLQRRIVTVDLYRIATNTALDKLRNRPFRVIREEDLSVDLESLKDSEVASALGLRLPAAKMRLHRARERLKKELSKYCVFYRNEENEFICDVKQQEDADDS